MANITPDYLRGFLVPSIGIKKEGIWDAQSTYTQANPRAGVPEAQNIGVNLTLSSIGTQNQEIDITTVQGGLPGDALFTWSGEDAKEYGKDADYILTEADRWIYSSSAVTTGTYFASDCISDLNGTLWVISEKVTTGNVHTIELRRQEKNGPQSLLKTFVALPGTFSANGLPCITRLQDGSLIVAYFQYTSQEVINIVVQRSYDNGDTWSVISPRGFKESINTLSYTPTKMRMVAIDNTVVLFVSLNALASNRVAQYISRDGGTTFQLVDKISDPVDGSLFECTPVALPDGSLGFAFISASDELKWVSIPNGGIRGSNHYWRVSNEYDIDTSGILFASGTPLANGHLCAWFQEGRIWVVAQQYGNGRLIAYYSEDNGVSWDYASGSTAADGYILDYGSNGDRLEGLSACVHEGRVKIFGHEDNSVWYLALGGYSTWNYPRRIDIASRLQYLVWESTYIPVMLPATSTQYSTIGAGTQAIDSEGLRIQTNSSTRYYRYNHSGGYFNEGQVIRFRMKVDTGTSLSADYIVMRINQDDGVNSVSLTFRFRTTSFLVRDNAGTLSTVTKSMTSPVEFVVCLNDTNAKIFYRDHDGDQAKDWTEISLTGITKYATGAGNTVEWGHPTIIAQTYQSHWNEVYISSGEQAGLFEFPLRGSQYPALGEYQYIDGGLAISAKDAPARGEDEYKIIPRYDYGIENIFHKISLSPRVVWRSTSDASGLRISLYTDPNVQLSSATAGLSDVLGCFLGNINFREFSIERYTSSWQNLVTVDTSEGLQGTYTRAGSTLISNVKAIGFYLQYGEAIGWRAEVSSGATTTVIKIKMNSEGYWTNETFVKRCVLTWDTDLTPLASIPSSGTIKLIPDSVTVLKGREDVLYTALSIWIPAQATLEGYFQIGSMIMGEVAFPAPQYQRGRTISYAPNIQAQSSLDGMFFARKMSEGRRTASIAWTEPIDTTKLLEGTADAWHYLAAQRAVANYGDPFIMEGVVRHLNNREPIVYLPSIEKEPTNGEIILNRRMDHMLARTTGEVTIESVLGEENRNELFRVATINLEEIE